MAGGQGRKRVKAVSHFIDKLEEGLLSSLMAAMVLLTFCQVVLRYGFNSGFIWGLELTTYCFAWLVLIGMSWGVKINTHLGVDLFTAIFPAPVQRALALFACFLAIAYGVILFVGSWTYITKMFRIGLATQDLYIPGAVAGLFTGHSGSVPVPRWIPYAALPLGLGLLVLRLAQAFWQILTGKRASLSASHEVEDDVVEEAAARAQEDRP